MFGSSYLGTGYFGGYFSDQPLIALNLRTGSPVIGAPVIGQIHVLSATNLVTGSPQFGEPELIEAVPLTAINLRTGSPTIGAPALG